MAEGTKLNPSTIVGGDTIDTELVGAVKIPRSKVVLGARDVDGGDVAANNPMPVTSRTGVAINTSVSPTPVAASALAANAARIQALFVNTGPVTVYLGQSTVTTVNGIPVLAGGSFVDDSSNSQWYAITASVTGSLIVCEVA